MKEVAKEIGRSLRTAKNWCRRNEIIIHRDGKTPFIKKMDFNLAWDAQVIEDLIAEYGKEVGLRVYKFYLEKNFEEILKIKFSLNKIDFGLNNRYVPVSENAKNF